MSDLNLPFDLPKDVRCRFRTDKDDSEVGGWESRITASKVSAICSLSGTSTKKVYRRMLGLDPPPEDNPYFQRGNELESFAVPAVEAICGDMFTHTSEQQVYFEMDLPIRRKESHTDSDGELILYPYTLGCSPDGLSATGDALVEVKSPPEVSSMITKYEFGPPPEYQVQITAQMMVTGLKKCYFGAYHADETRVWLCRETMDQSNWVFAAIKRFCNDYLTPQVEPPRSKKKEVYETFPFMDCERIF